MNKLMLELAKQAGLKFPSEVALSPPEIKFAQLIVQECMSFQDEAGVYSKFDMADAIAQHFGVEL